ncbi:hypothetical protein EHP00_1567 [Ecytonucleospora hepatopenaei]|uniref:Uncharacterized protein n=1 Tax=Ecytonucleospora hepatopenaei TaxID=646526 RepID=A0A1W0E6W9_9MICR|nr:hypothetical protein EHP00_1567 [Ecytonucleospora hepatopenaei]
MFFKSLSVFSFIKHSNFVCCSTNEYQTIDKEIINGLFLPVGFKLLIKNKIKQVLSSEVQKCTADNFKYFLIPLYMRKTYKNQDLEHSLVMEYDQKYFIPKGTEITHNSEKLKLMEDVEVKINSGAFELDDASAFVCVVGGEEITTMNSDYIVSNRAKNQLYQIPTIDHQKPVLTFSHGNISITDASIDKTEKFGLFRKKFKSSTAEMKPQLISFECNDLEKNEILNNKDALLFFKSDFDDVTLIKLIGHVGDPLTLNFKFDATVTNELSFDILHKFKLDLGIAKKPSDPKKPEKPDTALKTKEEEKEKTVAKKMSAVKLSLIIILPIVFIILAGICAFIYYKKAREYKQRLLFKNNIFF